MKIVMFSDDYLFYGGAQRYVYEISRCLSEMGNKVKIVTYRGRNEGTYEQNLNVKEVSFSNFPLRYIERSFFLKRMVALGFAFEGIDQDAIHVHGPTPPPLEGALMAKKLRRQPVVLTLHGFNPGLKEYYEHSLNQVDMITAVSHYVKREYEKVCDREIYVIPCGVNTEHFNPSINGLLIRAKYKLSNHFLVLYVGRLSPEKGLKYLLNAIHRTSEIKNVALMIVGEGPERPKLERLAKELNIWDRIFFTGYLPYEVLPYYYRACDVFVLPSTKETFGLVLLEAMACGRPVICTRVGGVPEFVHEGVNGLIVEPNSSVSLAEGLLYLYSNEEQRRDMGVEGRRLSEGYSWRRISEITFKTYVQLMIDSR